MTVIGRINCEKNSENTIEGRKQADEAKRQNVCFPAATIGSVWNSFALVYKKHCQDHNQPSMKTKDSGQVADEGYNVDCV